MRNVADKIIELHRSLPEGVRLCAVSKFHPAEAVQEAYAVGQRIFGESRVQELVAKYEALPKDIEWQMIGHLQTNKVRAIVPFVSLIQSLDSPRLAETIDREAERCGRATVDCLLEIHVASETSKSGWEWGELLAWLDSGAVARLPHLRIRGVMGMATNSDDETVVVADFARLKAYFEILQPRFGEAFDTLSMGMSDDYRLAIEQGSNMVRIGSSIFGERI